jgi:hypothetical protein
MVVSFRLALLSVLVAVLAGCASHQLVQSRWTENDLVGLHLALRDPAHPNAIEEYYFSRTFVDVTVGVKSRDETVITTPEYRWGLVNGRLRMGNGEEAVSWTLVSRDQAAIVVRTGSGELRSFEILAQPR